jgi:prophage maintenance system killer protein
MELFLQLNGRQLEAGDVECVQIMRAVAAGAMDETALSSWLQARTQRR